MVYVLDTLFKSRVYVVGDLDLESVKCTGSTSPAFGKVNPSTGPIIRFHDEPFSSLTPTGFLEEKFFYDYGPEGTDEHSG